ncbi:hypothetical protein JB92DRAFT_2834460 [Gautieria morchelliformis]|nr:hypothetical protein JB92DRAFT_2834460 [Gautieria morchelliformis]
MRGSNPFPPDPYGNPPPSLKSAMLHCNWYRLTVDAHEACWNEHLTGEESDTEPKSDYNLTSPSKLLPTKKAHATPMEEETARPKPVPSKPTSVSVSGTSAKTAKKPPNHAITYASQNVHVANNVWIGHRDAHGLAKIKDGRPLTSPAIPSTGAWVEIDLAGALKANVRELDVVVGDELNDEAGGSPMQAKGPNKQEKELKSTLQDLQGPHWNMGYVEKIC